MSLHKLFKASGIVMLALVAQISFAQKTITGTVTDSKDGSALSGASITAKGTTVGTQTDAKGAFRLTVDNNIMVLVISSVGFVTQEVSIASTSTVSVALVLTNNSLGEVVVIGYGSARRKDLTGAVATISSKDFNEGPIVSPEQLINGKVAGVQITAPDGLPGTSGRIRVRGTSSIGGSNDPLIVIDGVPMDQQSGISGAPSALSLINPNDIESYSILKDASATAIYGNRATNGVIIITTKKGRTGALRISFSTLNSVSVPLDMIDVLDADEFKALISGKGTPSQIAKLGTSNTDWQELVYHNGFTTDNNISLTGGINNLPYRLSLGYLNQNGILRRSNMNRFSSAVNISPKLFNNSLKVDFNFKGTLSNNFFSNNGAIGGSAFYDPTQPVHRSDNRFYGYFEWMNPANNRPEALGPKNPVGQQELRDDESDVTRIITNLQLDYTLPFFKELRINMNVGYDHTKGEGTIYIPDSAAMTYTRGGINNKYSQEKSNELFDIYLNYVKDINSIRSRLDVMAGYGYQDFERESPNYADYRANGTEFAPAPPFPSFNQNTLISFYGRLNFSTAGKYLFTFTLRRDGSSRFSPDTRWGTFPSAAFAWNIGEETFMKNSKCFSSLKLRLGYGETGQQEIGNDYAYIPNYTLGTQTAQYQFGNSFYPVNRPVGYDKDIRWETTTTYNAGIDFGFHNNRYSGSLDIYFKKTEDLLNRIPVPAGTNFTNEIFTNVGDMENKGVEFSFNATVLKNTELTWDAGFNITYNENEITKLTRVEDPAYVGVLVGGLDGAVGNTIQIHTVGYRPYSFFVLQQVYDANNKPVEGLYVDRNKDGIINNLDYYRYKSSEPKVMIGLHTNLQFQRWNFSTVVRANMGNYMYNNVFSSNGVFSTSSVNWLSNVHKNYQETGFGTYQYFSDYYVENASFVRMDNLTATYDFGRVFNKKANLRGVFSVSNVFVITNYRGTDPEISSGIDRLDRFFPRARVYSLGFNLEL